MPFFRNIVGWLLLSPVTLYPQMSAPPSSTTVIYGSQHPELIPDATAYRFILLSLSLPAHPTQIDITKQTLRFGRLGLSPSDTDALKSLLKNFTTSYAAWQDALPSTDRQAALADREDLIQRQRLLIEQRLSAEGVTNLQQYVNREKSKMYVPNTQTNK